MNHVIRVMGFVAATAISGVGCSPVSEHGGGGGSGSGGSGSGGSGGSSDCNGPDLCSGDVLWAKGFGGVDHQSGTGVVTDAQGNLVIGGCFHDALDLGGGPLISEGGADNFVAKLDPDGNHLWSKRFGDAGSANPAAIGVDRAGDILIFGDTHDTVDLGGGPITNSMYLAKLDSDGQHLWSKGIAHDQGVSDFKVTTDADNNIVLAGTYFGTVDFGAGPLSVGGAEDVFVVKLDPNGKTLWSRGMGGGAMAKWIKGIAIDSLGNVLAAGEFVDSIDLGGGPLQSAGIKDVYIVKLDPAGKQLWSRRFGGESYDYCNGIAVDAKDNVALAGSFSDTADYGNGPFISAGDVDMFLLKLNSSGDLVFGKQFGAEDSDGAYGIGANGERLLVVGGSNGTIDVGGGPFTFSGDGMFAAGFDQNGNHLWSDPIQAGPMFGFGGAAVDPKGNLLVTGEFAGTLHVGDVFVPGGGGEDMFLIKFSP